MSKRQATVNETIRDAYAFLKYTERIKDEGEFAADIFSKARAKWLTAIVEGIEIVKESQCEIEMGQLMTRLVSKTTVMKHGTYIIHYSQGPALREKWYFPWEECS